MRRALPWKSTRSGAGSENEEEMGNVDGECAETVEPEDDIFMSGDRSETRRDINVPVLDRPSLPHKASTSSLASYSDTRLRDSMSMEHLNLDAFSTSATSKLEKMKHRPSNLKLDLNLSHSNAQFNHGTVVTDAGADQEAKEYDGNED